MKILLVEDEVHHFDIFLEGLNDLNHQADPELLWAKNSDQAINLMRGGGIDIVFVDLTLRASRHTGFEFIEYLRSKYPDLPIITYTVSESKEDKEKAYAAGANLFTQKPVQFGELMTLLCYIIDSVINEEPLLEA